MTVIIANHGRYSRLTLGSREDFTINPTSATYFTDNIDNEIIINIMIKEVQS